MNNDSHIQKKEATILFGILLLATIIRIIHINTGYLFTDDYPRDIYRAHGFIDRGLSYWTAKSAWSALGHLPLNGFLISLSFRIFGEGEAYARIIPVLAGLLTVLAVYYLGALYDKKTGLIASFLLATSYYHILFNQSVTPYSLITFLFSITILLFYVGLNDRKNNLICASIILAALTPYAHFLGLLLPLMLMISAIFLVPNTGINLRTSYRILASVAVAILLLTMYFYLILSGGSFDEQSSYYLGGEGWCSWYAGYGIYCNQPLRIFIYEVFDILSLPFTLICFFGVLWALLKRRNKTDKMLLFWIILPLVINIMSPTRGPRYILMILPPTIVLSARFINELWNCIFTQKISRIHATSLILFLFILVFMQPGLYDYMAPKQDTVSKYLPIDVRVIGDNVNPYVDKSDIVFSDYPHNSMYVKSNVKTYWGPSIVSVRNIQNYNPKFIIIGTNKKGEDGSGGGPVWICGNYSHGKVCLTTIEMDRLNRTDIILEMIDPNVRSKGGKIAVIYSDSKHKGLNGKFNALNYQYDSYDASVGGISKVFREKKGYPVVIFGSGVADNDLSYVQILRDNSLYIRRFLLDGGTLIVLGVSFKKEFSQLIDWLPLETMVYTRNYSMSYDLVSEREIEIPYNRIWLKGNLTHIPSNGFFYLYDKNYSILAATEDYTLISENYSTHKIFYSEYGRPVISIYRIKQ